MTYDIGNLAFLPIRSNDDFARRLANRFNLKDPDGLVKNSEFSNREYCPTITDILSNGHRERLKDRIACIVHSYTQSHLSNTEAFSRILLLSDAAIRSGASDIYLIMAESLFDRQDLNPEVKFTNFYDKFPEKVKYKIDKMQGQSFSLEVTIKHFKEAGINKVLTLDAHSDISEQLYGLTYKTDPKNVFFNLDPNPIFVNYLLESEIDKGQNGENLVLVAPDFGAWNTIDKFLNLLNMENTSAVYCNKFRQVPNDPDNLKVTIEKNSNNFCGIKDKIIIGIDDKGDTLGTLEKTLINDLTSDGKPRQVHAFLSHLILSTKEAYLKIANNRINLHGSNSHANIVYKKDEPGIENITVLDFTPYFAWALVNHVIPGKPIAESKKKSLDEYKGLYEIIKKGKSVNFSS